MKLNFGTDAVGLRYHRSNTWWYLTLFLRRKLFTRLACELQAKIGSVSACRFIHRVVP